MPPKRGSLNFRQLEFFFGLGLGFAYECVINIYNFLNRFSMNPKKVLWQSAIASPTNVMLGIPSREIESFCIIFPVSPAFRENGLEAHRLACKFSAFAICRYPWRFVVSTFHESTRSTRLKACRDDLHDVVPSVFAKTWVGHCNHGYAQTLVLFLQPWQIYGNSFHRLGPVPVAWNTITM